MWESTGFKPHIPSFCNKSRLAKASKVATWRPRRRRWSQEAARAWSHTLSPEQRSEQSAWSKPSGGHNRGVVGRQPYLRDGTGGRRRYRPQTNDIALRGEIVAARVVLSLFRCHILFGGLGQRAAVLGQWETDSEDGGLQQKEPGVAGDDLKWHFLM